MTLRTTKGDQNLVGGRIPKTPLADARGSMRSAQ